MAAADYTALVQELYISYFGRPADPRGLDNFTKALDGLNAPTNIDDLVAALASPAGQNDALKTLINTSFSNSDEAKALYNNADNLAFVGQIYKNVLNRTGDTEGLLYWAAKLDNHELSRENAAIAIMQGALANDSTQGLLDAKLVTAKVAVATNFTTSIDTGDELLAYMGNAAAATARDMLGQITSSTDATAFQSTVEATLQKLINVANPGQTFTLTTGVDTFNGTSSDDLFAATVTATSNPLGGLDALNGNGGNDTFKIADSGTAAGADFNLTTGLTVSGIENLQVITNGALGNSGTAFDISGMSGLTSANLTAVGAGTTTGSNIKAASSTDVTLQVTGANAAKVTGGKAVTVNAGTGAVDVTGTGLTSVTVNGGDVGTIDNVTAGGTSGGASTLTSVVLDGVTGSADAIKGKGVTNVTLANIAQADVITLTNSTAAHTINLTVKDTGYDDNGTVALEFRDAVAKTTAITAAGDYSNIKVTTAAATSATVAGAGALDLDLSGSTALTSIDASANTGGVNFSGVVAGVVNFKGGAGDDTVTTAQTTKFNMDMGAGDDIVTLGANVVAGSNINLGAGNDRLLDGGFGVEASTSTATTVIDGGAGTDTIGASLINAANAGLFKNFEGVDLSGATSTALDVELITGSTISALTLSGGTGGSVVNNVAAGVGLTVSGSNTGTSTINLKSTSGTADAFTVTFAGAAAQSAPSAANVKAGTVVVNGVENMNLVSGGAANTWNSVTLTDSKLKVVTITGAKNLDLSFAGTTGTNGSSGTGGVNTIDGSAATGKLKIDTTGGTFNADGNGLTVKGGSANDTITLGQWADVNGGAGNDKIVVSADGADLTGGAGTDTFDLHLAVATGTTAATSALTLITDFASGDSIVFGTETSVVAFDSTKVTLGSSVTNLDLALAAAGTQTANHASWFQYGGNTYIVADVNGSGTFNAGDVVVKLQGVVDLSTAGLTVDATTSHTSFLTAA